MGKISVIVPIYNVGQYLDECINSIVNQTYKNIELILVDDGSTDCSGTICDEWSKKDSRIVVIHKENGGVGSARNAGLKASTGEYIDFVDGDDFLPEDALEVMYSSLTQSGADMFIGRAAWTDEKGELLPYLGKTREDKIIDEYEFWTRRNKFEKYVICPSKLYKRKLFSEIEFGQYKNHEDQGILWKIVSQCDKIYDSDKVIYYYRHRNDSATTKPYSSSHLALSEVLIPEIKYLMDRDWIELAVYSWGMGTRNIAEGYRKLKKKSKETGKLLSARRAEYRKLGAELKDKVKGHKLRVKLRFFYLMPRTYLGFVNFKSK